MALPKLDMGTVKDSEEKEKKTLRDSMRKLSRKASASLRRGLTPRGSRVERKDSFDSLEDAAAQDDPLAGALGPNLAQVSTSGSESLPPQPLSAPPLVDAPPREHERLPQFEPAEGAFSAAKDEASELGTEQLPEPADDGKQQHNDTAGDSEQEAHVSIKAAGDGKQEASVSVKAASADEYDLRRPPAGKGDPAPHVEAPPKSRADPPHFDDTDDHAAATAAKASAWEPVPAGAAAAEPTIGDAQEEAAAMVQDPPSPPRKGRAQWQEMALAVSVFAVGIIAAEPALAAWRRRRQPQAPPVVDAKAAKKKGGWGFS
jgi:hypothetical protein